MVFNTFSDGVNTVSDIVGLYSCPFGSGPRVCNKVVRSRYLSLVRGFFGGLHRGWPGGHYFSTS